jgi:DNA-binding Lrp family transcriptional regulator
MMERNVEREVPAVLEEILEEPLHGRRGNSGGALPREFPVDLVLETGDRSFLVECKSSASVRILEGAIAQLRRARAYFKDAIPVIAVPFMGGVGKQLCRSAAVSWVDLAGNANLRGPGIYIRIEGRPDRNRKPGRPANVFAPKSARVTRRLLLDPERTFRQRELAQETVLGEGFVSRIVRQLEAEGFIEREGGVIRAKNPGLLLDAWREAYAFDRHHIIRGHIPTRSPQYLLGSLTESLREQSISHAATGPASAWQHARFAGFRVVTVYVQEPPSYSALHFRPDERGANVWLIVPDDPGVLDGTVELEGIRCVSAVQTYLDLLAMPERAQEAADELRHKRLPWSIHG